MKLAKMTEAARLMVEDWNSGGGYLKTQLAPAILDELAERIDAFVAQAVQKEQETIDRELHARVDALEAQHRELKGALRDTVDRIMAVLRGEEA